MEIYNDIFKSWSDVQYQFSMSEKEPDEVLYAYYNYEDYSGSADVYYRNGDKFYHVSGGHCSCYGLETQWEPEEYDRETFIALLKRKIETNTETELSNYLLSKAEKQND